MKFIIKQGQEFDTFSEAFAAVKNGEIIYCIGDIFAAQESIDDCADAHVEKKNHGSEA